MKTLDKERIEKEIKSLEFKIKQLKSELNRRSSFVLMYIEKSGKHTFVLQPTNQKKKIC